MAGLTAAPAERSPAPAVTRAAAVLEVLAARHDGPIGVRALARQLGLPPSSVANVCAALADAQLVRSGPEGFVLGPKLAQLGAAYLAGVDEVGLFHAAVGRAVAVRDETTQLATLAAGLDVVYLARRDGAFPVRLASAPGVALPASCTATGKAMLASFETADLADRLPGSGRLPRLTARSITSVRGLRAELALSRDRGYAVDREEMVEGVVCVAVAVPGRATEAPLAVSCTLLAPRATPGRLTRVARALQTVAADLAVDLGGPATESATESATDSAAGSATRSGGRSVVSSGGTRSGTRSPRRSA